MYWVKTVTTKKLILKKMWNLLFDDKVFTPILEWSNVHMTKIRLKYKYASRSDTRNLDLIESYLISSSDNPADSTSHSLFPTALISHSLWFFGPQWLSSYKQWPGPSYSRVGHTLFNLVRQSVKSYLILKLLDPKFFLFRNSILF